MPDPALQIVATQSNRQVEVCPVAGQEVVELGLRIGQQTVRSASTRGPNVSVGGRYQ